MQKQRTISPSNFIKRNGQLTIINFMQWNNSKWKMMLNKKKGIKSGPSLLT